MLKQTWPQAAFFDGSSSSNNGIVIDSMALDINNDSLYSFRASELKPFYTINLSKRLEKRKPIIFIPDSLKGYTTKMNIIDTLLDPTISIQGYGYLQHFFSKLRTLENNGAKKVRVAYYGDSMNDGDLIVQDLRDLMQTMYGGNGVGMVSITSMSGGSRGSVSHKFSNNWKTQSFVSVRKPSTSFGVDGQVFLAEDISTRWASFSAGNMSQSKFLPSPTLFYGSSENKDGKIDVRINGKESMQMTLDGNNLVNTKSLGASSAQSIKVDFENIQNIPIYGLDFSGSTGVYIDNFSLRGNSGLPLSSFNSQLINSFNSLLGYDLIVLQYGTNVLNYGSLDYSWYEKSMTNVIKKLKECYPNADILIISVGDKSSKKNMEMVTDAAVIPLVNAQKRFARENGVGFIDLYNLMGGKNSMVEWVRNGKANKDYTHFNIKGSKEIGVLLFGELQKAFEKYKVQLDREYKKSKIN